MLVTRFGPERRWADGRSWTNSPLGAHTALSEAHQYTIAAIVDGAVELIGRRVSDVRRYRTSAELT